MNREAEVEVATRIMPLPSVAACGFRLRVVEGDGAVIGRDFVIDESCLIGRGADCDVVLHGDALEGREDHGGNLRELALQLV